METLPELQLMPLFLTALGSIAGGVLLYRFGGREGRSWAVPVAAAILIYGVSEHYDLPWWAMAGGVLLAPPLFHRVIRRRQEKVAASAAARIQVGGMTIRRVPDPTGRHIAVWTTAPEGPPRVTLLPGAEPLQLTLDIEGETEDEYRIVLHGRVLYHVPGACVAHHAQTPAASVGLLADQDRLEGLPGMTPELVVRAMPAEYAYRLLDIPTLAALQGLVELSDEKREVYVHVDGPELRVVAGGSYRETELPRAVGAAFLVLSRVRAVGIEERRE